MKKNMIVTFSLLLLLGTAMAQPADVVKEIQKIRAYYTGTDLKHVKGQMLLSNMSTGAPVDKVDFEYWLKDKMVFTKMNYIEILSNRSVYVMVNNKYKTIYARPQDKIEQKPAAMIFDAEQLGRILSVKGATSTLTVNNGQNRLSMSGFNDPRFSSIIINYAADDYRIFSIEATVKESEATGGQKLKLKVLYNVSEKIGSGNEPAIFSASKYLQPSKKGNLEYTPNYIGYKKI